MRRLESTKPGRELNSQPTNDRANNVDLTTVRDQRSMILSILCDFLEEDRIADLVDWLDHVGFDLTAIRYPTDLPAAWVAHYRNGRSYDVDRALNDLLAWPPIAAEIAFLSKQSQLIMSAPSEPGKRAPQKLTDRFGKTRG